MIPPFPHFEGLLNCPVVVYDPFYKCYTNVYMMGLFIRPYRIYSK